MSAASKTPFFLNHLLEYDGFINILKSYIDLNTSIVTPKNWLLVNQHQRLQTPFDLEKKYGLIRRVNEDENPHFRKAVKEGCSVLGEYLGLYDLFVPIKKKGKNFGVILSGLFATEEWNYQKLEKSWAKISRQSASPENPAFLEFVQIALDTPVLEGEVYAAFQESCEIFAGLLTGESGNNAAFRRLAELPLTVFSKHLPHLFWMDWALGRSSRYVMPVWSKEVQDLDWVRNEIGIDRVPTTVITAIPVKTIGKKTDPVAEALLIRKFQRQSFYFAKTLPQTVGGKLENYGSVFVTSADPSKSRLQRRNQIEDIARRIHEFSVRELGGAALVGIGETVSPGEPLSGTYRQAVLALHVGRHSGKEIVFFNPERGPATEGLAELRRLLVNLARQFASASFSDMEMARDGFVQQVLTLSFRSPEEIRWHLQYALIQIMEAVRQRADLKEKDGDELYQSLALGLEKTITTQEMILAFREALAKLSERTGRLETLQAAYSIEKARDHIEAHFREPLRVARLAKITGVSGSTFSRRFKKLTGIGLEVYLQNRRLEEAKRLLKTGSLPVFRIGKECGFKSNPYFIQLFRKKTGLSPQKYRRKFQRV